MTVVLDNLAVVFVFLLLAAQYESWTLPLAHAGFLCAVPETGITGTQESGCGCF